MSVKHRKIEFAETLEVERRRREIQLLANVMEPDPEYQAFFLSDEATFFDICGVEEALIRTRLEAYFGGPFPIPLTTRLWRAVELLKLHFPGWPDRWPPDVH